MYNASRQESTGRSPTANPHRNPATAQSGRKKILIIDDDPAILDSFVLILEQNGYQTARANYALPALFQVLRDEPDLILADLDMPLMNGLELLHQFKTHLETKDIPVVVVTGSTHPGDREEALKAGCAGYITKPVSGRDLIGEIDKVLHHQAGKRPKMPAAKDNPAKQAKRAHA